MTKIGTDRRARAYNNNNSNTIRSRPVALGGVNATLINGRRQVDRSDVHANYCSLPIINHTSETSGSSAGFGVRVHRIREYDAVFAYRRRAVWRTRPNRRFGV